MKVKDLVKLLQQENQEVMDDNHWGCNISLDDINKTDLVITPTIDES